MEIRTTIGLAHHLEVLESVCLHRKTKNESIQMMRNHMGISVRHFLMFLCLPQFLCKRIFTTTRKRLLHNKQKVNASQTLFKDSILAPKETLIYFLATLLWP